VISRGSSTTPAWCACGTQAGGLLEICYTAQLKTGWTLQPDFQYVWQPGGSVPEPSGKGIVPNAAVWGLRTTINF
jgi:porin